MLSFAPGLKVFVAPGVTDLRKGFSGLTALAANQLRQDPRSGHVFAFCNRRRSLIKLLLWDGSGFWVMAKRLESGTFAWPSGAATDTVTMSIDELGWLLGGLDPREVTRRDWWRREPTLSAAGVFE